jgi:hypothetical protein
MSEAIYLWIWGMVLVVAIIPGAIVGWLAGKFIPSMAGGLAITICASLLAGSLASAKIFPGQTQYQYPLMFVPPILLALLLGLWLGRRTR